MYHTQEKWRFRLTSPVKSTKPNAWLGNAYYFWLEEMDALEWGHGSKRNKDYFEVYCADIDTENVLDTVFNEAHYNFWIEQLEKAAKTIVKRTGIKPTIKEINNYFVEKATWKTVNGILFQDLPFNDRLLVEKFNYRKRIQIGVFELKIMSNFTYLFERQCI